MPVEIKQPLDAIIDANTGLDSMVFA